MVNSSALMRAAMTVLMLVVSASCGSGPTQPPPSPQLTVTCPAAAEGQSLDGGAVAVTYSSPTTTGGVAPVNLACTPQSGSFFTGGTTRVTCTATDSRGTVATCNTSVFVRLPPRLVGTKFMAFGDSITAGRYSDPVSGFSITISQFAYPELLLPQLVARYRQQTITMANEGVPSDMAHVDGIARIRGALLTHRPDVVLLMMGTNDLLVPLGVERAIEGLTQIIAEARSAEFNARVVLATVPPQRANVPPLRPVPHLVPILNDRIRALAQAQGLPLADVYNAMKDNLSLIGQDNLHPTPAGFAVIAKTFYDTIVASLEAPQPAVQGVR